MTITVTVTDGTRTYSLGENTAEATRQATIATNAANAAAAAGNYFATQSLGEAGTLTGEFFSYNDGGLIYAERTVGGSVVIGQAATSAQVDAVATTVTAITTDLASTDSAKGAALVGYRTSTVAQRLSGEWSVLENLTKAQADDVLASVNGDDLAPKIQEMLSDSAITSLTFPPGFYRVEGGASDTECLLLDRNINLLAPGGQQRTRLVGYMAGNTTGAVMKVKFAGSGDVRNWTMRGLAIFPEPSVGGKDGLLIDDAGLPMLTCRIEDCLFGRNPTNAGRAAYFGFALAHSLVQGNTFSGGALAECGDANLFSKNLHFGAATEFAYVFDLVDGVRNNTVRDCTIVNQGGALHVIDGQEIRFINNQCEQAGGVNGNPVEAMIWLQGTTREVQNTFIAENNFGGGTNYKRSIYIDNARGTKIVGGNRLIAPGQDSIGGNADVFTTALAVDTLIGPDNFVEPSAFSIRRDRLTPARTNDSGAGTVNSRRVPTLSNGWLGGAFHKDQNGVIRFRSKLTSGTLTAGTIMATMPSGYAPAQKTDVVRRNLLDKTNDLSTTSWVRSAITVTAAQGTAPNGRNEYTLIAAAATTAVHQVRDDGTNLTTLDPVRVTFYIQRTSGTTSEIIRGTFDHGTPSSGAATYTMNLTTGVIVITPSSGAAATATMTAADGGWLVNIAYTPAVVGNHFLRFTPKNEASVSSSYAGDPAVHNFLLWGPQVEVAGTATAYQAIYSATEFSTQIFEDTLKVETTAGTETVTINQSGVIKAATLTAADVTMPAFQSDVKV